jgi:hypothetical protein
MDCRWSMATRLLRCQWAIRGKRAERATAPPAASRACPGIRAPAPRARQGECYERGWIAVAIDTPSGNGGALLRSLTSRRGDWARSRAPTQIRYLRRSLEATLANDADQCFWQISTRLSLV